MKTQNVSTTAKLTMTQEQLDAQIALGVQKALEANKPKTTVSFEKYNGFDTVRIKGNFSNGGFTLGARKVAALFTDPIRSEVETWLKGKGLIAK